ncbi:MAG: MaoC/PaaZ C-terminal domain-containing protein [Nevskiales bacterium]
MVTDALRIEYQTAPSLLTSYLRAATARPGGGAIPRMDAVQRAVAVDAGKLADYRKVCGFAAGRHLPVTFPHILAAPLHLGLLTQKTFPLRLLGLVHVRNVIRQMRPLAPDERLDLHVFVEGQREVPNGIEFDLVTEVDDALGRRVWESVSSNLSRRKSKDKRGSPPKRHGEEVIQYEHTERWKVPGNIGRRYAGVSGDVNPIHLTWLTARALGFPRAIAHGMWSLARCAAAFEREQPAGAFQLSVAFKLPVLLPAKVQLQYRRHDGALHYVLSSADGSKPHLAGELR